jgi:hypothetical protein
MTTTPYFSYNGVVCPGLIRPKQSAQGGQLKLDVIPRPGSDMADVFHAGRDAAQYPWKAFFLSKTDMDTFLNEVNNSTTPNDASPQYIEFCPFRDDRAIYVQYASARVSDAEIGYPLSALGYIYSADVKIYAKEARWYDVAQGIAYGTNVSITGGKYSTTLTNNGGFPNGLDWLLLSGIYSGGYYTSGTGYLIRSATSQTYGSIALCTKHIQKDRFVLDRYGNCEHSYLARLNEYYSNMQTDLWGATYCNSGSISSNILTIGNSGKTIFPMSGPLPAKYAYLDIWVTAITGAPKAQWGVLSSLADLATFNTLQVGRNTIYLPSDIRGKGDLYFGIVCGGSDSVSISYMQAVVGRYVAPSAMPLVPIGQTFQIGVYDTTISNHLLNQLCVVYRDAYSI